jgi:hypothetical protein
VDRRAINKGTLANGSLRGSTDSLEGMTLRATVQVFSMEGGRNSILVCWRGGKVFEATIPEPSAEIRIKPGGAIEKIR